MDIERFPDVTMVRARARATWEEQERQRMGIQETIGASVPWWLILIAIVFWLLSAPHTAATFDRLTPGWGWVAPVGVEFGLLYAAFRRKQAKDGKQGVHWTLIALEILLFVTAILVNGAGSFISVAETSGLQKLSVSQLRDQFGALPAGSQVALGLVPLAAFIIPIGTSVAGEGLAQLILERRTGGILEQRWRLVSAEIEFVALRDEAVRMGVSPGRATAWAMKLTGGVNITASTGASTRLSIEAPKLTDKVDNLDARIDKMDAGNGQRRKRDPWAREKAKEYLQTHPEAVHMTARALGKELGISHEVANQVLREVRQMDNGQRQ